MLKRTFGILLATFVALAGTQAARAEESFNYPVVLHSYWKLAPPNSYELFADSYAKEFADVVPPEKEGVIEAIKKNVDDVDLDDPVMLPISLRVGPYVPLQKAFVFAPFTTGISIPTGPHVARDGNLPLISVIFTNGPKIRSLPMSPEDAAKMQKYDTADYRAEVKFIAKKANALSKELKGLITEITLIEGQRDVAHMTFDEKTGDLIEAKYVGGEEKPKE